jgi:predicted flap endonuclease-1-like 5' DNA nuclease
MSTSISLCDLPWWAVALSWLLPALLGYFWAMLQWSRYKSKSNKAEQDLNSASRRIVNLENEVNECRKSYDKVNKEREKLLAERSGAMTSPAAPITKASTPEASSGISEIIHDTKAVFGYAIKRNDLKIVDGIDPKIEKLLNDHGITDWAKMEMVDMNTLNNLLQSSGYANLNPQSWPYQSSLARQGKWEELKTFQASKG